ncbi:siderophore ferric iron reductase [Aliihoeflea sp. PC F10.4]
MAISKHSDEAAFMAAVHAAMPGIDAEFGETPPDWLGGEDDRQDAEAVATLHREIATAFPGAGRAYHAVRSWSMLVWQPAMTGVMAVHSHGLALPVERMGQRVADGGVYGFRLPGGLSSHGTTEHLIDITAMRIRAMSDRLHALLGEIAPMKEKIAFRLLADRILGTLVHIHAHEPQLRVCDHAAHWLDAAGLGEMSGLAEVTLDSGAPHPVLDRKACCLHYLCEPGALCMSCPKQPREIRLARMRDYWNGHA